VKRHLLLAMLILFSMSLLGTNYIYATTPNQQNSEMNSNTITLGELTAGVQQDVNNTTNIQNTTVRNLNEVQAVNNTNKNQSTSTTVNSVNSSKNLNNSSNSTVKIQSATQAAGDEIYNNVHGLWLSVDDVKNVNADELKNSGITDVFVKANRISDPLYPSVLKSIINKLKGTGIRVHAWITCFVDQNGNWIDPKNVTNQNNIIKAITDITKNYNINGIFLDYVRYPGTAYKTAGATNTITSFVAKVYSTVKSIKPKVAVSAALMPEGAVNSYYYGQDYSQLSKYLDFLVPMVYSGNYNENSSWITSTTKYIVAHSNGKPVIAGLQTYRSDKNLTIIPASEIRTNINSAIKGGASGYALFRYGWLDKSFFKIITPVKNTTTSTTTNSYTVADIKNAATKVKAYIEKNNCLPNYVQMGTRQVTMPEFLRLLTAGLLKVSSGSSGTIAIKSALPPVKPTADLKNGNIYKSEYLSMAGKIISFIDSNGKAPNYATSTLGKIQYESLVYMYSRIMNYYGTNKVLSNYVSMKPWQTTSSDPDPLIPAALQIYLQPTNNCQSTSPTIKVLAASITSGTSSTYQKGVDLFNWVRNNIGYSFYYNTKYGALGTLSAKTGNCVDTTHLLIALSRAAGIPARYVNGVCQFNSGTWYGHVWAQLYVNGKWYNADAISLNNQFGVINNWNTNSWTLKGIYSELPF
jgi:hypothetical protein